MEIEADKRSIELIQSKCLSEQKTTAQLGITVAVCSALFFKKEVKSKTHPDADNRILHALEALDVDDNGMEWILATDALYIWLQKFDIQNIDRKEEDTFKAYFISLSRQLE